MAGFPGATGSLVPAHNILSTDLAFHVQLPIKSWGMQMRVGHWCSITVQRARRRSVNDWQLFCWVEEEQRTEAGIPSGKPVVSARSFYIWFPYLFFFFFPPSSFFFPPLSVFLNARPKKYLAQLVLQIHSLVSSADCQGHISRRLGFFLLFPSPFLFKIYASLQKGPRCFSLEGAGSSMESVIIVHFGDFCCPFRTQEIWCQPFHDTHLTPFVSSFCHEIPLGGPDLQGSVAGKDEKQQQSYKIRNCAWCVDMFPWAPGLAAPGPAGMCHARQTQANKVWQKGRVCFPPPWWPSSRNRMILSNFKWVSLCFWASVTAKSSSETCDSWEQKPHASRARVTQNERGLLSAAAAAGLCVAEPHKHTLHGGFSNKNGV